MMRQQHDNSKNTFLLFPFLWFKNLLCRNATPLQYEFTHTIHQTENNKNHPHNEPTVPDPDPHSDRASDRAHQGRRHHADRLVRSSRSRRSDHLEVHRSVEAHGNLLHVHVRGCHRLSMNSTQKQMLAERETAILQDALRSSKKRESAFPIVTRPSSASSELRSQY